MKNLVVTCYLKSPLCQEPPKFDSLLGWVQGIEQESFISRSVDLYKTVVLDIPLEKEKYDNDWFYKCSNPLYNIDLEWFEYWSKRIDTEKIALKVKNHPKNINTGGGMYKMRYSPLFCKQIEMIKWFCVGDKFKIEKILQDILAIGNKRSIGYGFIKFWEVTEIEKDYSIYYEIEGGKYLLKTVPLEYYREMDFALQNIKKEYGAYRLPYWHIDNYKDLICPF